MTLTAQQSTELRQALDRVRRDKQELAGQLRAARTEYGKVQHRLTEGKADQSEAFAAKKEVDSLESKQQDLRDEEATYLGLLGQQMNGTGPGRDAFSHFSDPDFKRELAALASTSARFGDKIIATFDPETVASWTGKSLAAAPVAPPTPGMTEPAMSRMVPYPTPPTSFLDLVPSVTTEVPSTLFAQEVAATGGGPAPAAPGSVKPIVGLEYVDAESTSETIAGYLKMNRQSLADVPGLQQAAQNRMMTKLRQALEGEVLSGDGSVSDITGKEGMVGLLNTSGLGAVAIGSGAGWLPPDDILDAIVTCLVSGAQPNVIVMNQGDWADLMKTKATGSGEYVGGGPFLTTASQVWNVPLVPSVAMPPGKTLVGDTRIGLTLQVREGANLRISDSDTDDYTRNRVTLLCEGRWSLCVWVPAAFCVLS